MKLNWQAVMAVFALAAFIDLAAKGSNIPFLIGLEPVVIVYLAFTAIENFWQIHFFFLFFSLFSGLVNLQPVGMSSAALYVAYLIVKVVNRILNFMGEGKFLFSLVVLVTTIFIKSRIMLLFQPATLPLSVSVLVVNVIVYVLIYLLFTRIFSNNVYSRKGI